MPWQQHVLDVGLEVDDTGRFVYRRAVVHVQRRAGKTTKTFVKQAHRAITRPASLNWYGAQSRKDGLEIWDQQLSELLLPHKDTLGFRHRRSVGSESLRFGNGARVALFTPAESSLVGLSTDLVDVDEARFHSIARGLSLEAGIRPTQATRDGQLWIESSSGTFGLSDWLWSHLERGRQSVADGVDTGLAFFDYSIPDDADPLNLDIVCAHHPAVGFTIGRDFLEAEALDMDENDFAREYAGRWTSSVSTLIPAAAWAALADPGPKPAPGVPTLAFGTTPGREVSAIALGWLDSEQLPRVAIADQRAGEDWLVDRVLELAAKYRPTAVTYNAIGPATSTADKLERRGLTLKPCATNDYVVACAAFYEAVLAGRMHHHGQPDLDAAVKALTRRDLGDRWVWGHRKSPAPIVAAEAATVAAWAAEHPEPVPPPPTSAVAV